MLASKLLLYQKFQQSSLMVKILVLCMWTIYPLPLDGGFARNSAGNCKLSDLWVGVISSHDFYPSFTHF
jgi:hypothetical protein